MDFYSKYRYMKEISWGCREHFQSLDDLIANVKLDFDHLHYVGPFHHGTGTIIESLQSVLEETTVKQYEDNDEMFAEQDIIVLRYNDKLSAYCIQSTDLTDFTGIGIRLVEVPELLNIPYVYYCTERPIEADAFPKTQGGPKLVENYEGRVYADKNRAVAWGKVTYFTPLSEQLVRDYELQPARNNPAHIQLPVFPQRFVQVIGVGEWEQENKMPHSERLTYCSRGDFIAKDTVNDGQIAERYWEITGRRQTQ